MCVYIYIYMIHGCRVVLQCPFTKAWCIIALHFVLPTAAADPVEGSGFMVGMFPLILTVLHRDYN